MMKRLHVAPLLTVMMAAGTVPAAEPALDVIGFSDDGSLLAYTLTGEHEGSAFPFCEVHILDTVSGSPKASFSRTDDAQSVSPPELREALVDSLRPELFRSGIREGYRGVFIEYPALDSPPGMEMLSFQFRDEVSGLPSGLYSLDLFQAPVDTSQSFFGMSPSACELNLTSADRSLSAVLLEPGTVFPEAGTSYGFAIEEMLLHPSGVLVVFMSLIVEGYEVPSKETIPLVFRDCSGIL